MEILDSRLPRIRHRLVGVSKRVGVERAQQELVDLISGRKPVGARWRREGLGQNLASAARIHRFGAELLEAKKLLLETARPMKRADCAVGGHVADMRPSRTGGHAGASAREGNRLRPENDEKHS